MIIVLIHPITNPLYAAELANSLSKNESQVTVIVPKYSYSKEQFNPNVDIILLNTSQSYVDMFLKTINPLTYFKIYRLINKINPDVIHVTWDLVWFNILAPILRKKWPLIITDHEPIGKNTKVTFYGKYIYRATRPFTRTMSDALIVHSEKLKNGLVKNGMGEDKVYVIPHGVFTYYNRWCKERIKEQKVILFFGFIEDYKGIEYLIKAEPLISKEVQDAKIIIAGKGDFSQYGKLIKHENSFEIINEFVPDEKVAELFQRASLVVVPYTDASQSGVLTIAYSFGKPVIATDVGGLSEAVDDGRTGYIVPPKDEKALANAIIKLLQDDKLRIEMSENVSTKAQEISWDNIAKKHIEVYEKVITR